VQLFAQVNGKDRCRRVIRYPFENFREIRDPEGGFKTRANFAQALCDAQLSSEAVQAERGASNLKLDRPRL
jgi:hypothetical protein